MDKKLHYWLPPWIIAIINKKTCSKCSNKINSSNIIAVGIREAPANQKVLFTEQQCPSCKTRSVAVFNKEKANSLKELCFSLLESIKKKRQAEISVDLSKANMRGEIKQDKVDEFLTFLQDVETHDEFMKRIGCPLNDGKKDSDIDK